MFIAIEGGEDTRWQDQVDKNRTAMANKLWNITSELNVFNKTQFTDR